MAMIKIGDPWADVPTPSLAWTCLTDEQRKERVSAILRLDPVITTVITFNLMNDEPHPFLPPDVVSASQSGQVILTVPQAMKARERGIWLRQAERHLKLVLDPALVIYLDPKQDKNALRLLRGVEVRT